jgi:DNA-directed RNA polymerase subunit RPC12/RpoP
MRKKNDEDIRFPSLIEQGKNLAKFVADGTKAAASGKKLVVPEEVKKARLKKCKRCEELYESIMGDHLNRCRACGCFIEVKTSTASAQCPRKKWDRWEGENK